MNELLWIALLAANFLFILVAFRLFGKFGLFAWMPVSVIAANIQVVKTVELFGITATLGNIVYASSFLITDILSENYGKRDARRAVLYGLAAIIGFTALMALSVPFRPSSEDTAHQHLEALFTVLPRITLASVAAYVVSQFHDVWAYAKWRQLFPSGREIWLRNNLSTLVSQLLDSAVFTAVAFWGVFPLPVFLEILVTTYVLKAVVAICDTPLVYVARSWVQRRKIIHDDEPVI